MTDFTLWWYFSATWWIPPLRLRYGRNDKWGDVSGFYREQFRPFRCGTAHRPFPTVSLIGGRFQPGVLRTGVYGGAFLRIRLLFPECFRPYRSLISQGCALPASPEGKLLYRAFGWRFYRNIGTKVIRPSSKNCQLSIVNCQLGITVNCPLSTVNFFSPPSYHTPPCFCNRYPRK